MDTRTKIVQPSDAARIAASGAIVVSGYFDPLLASHADRLEELKRQGKPLLVLIATPENAILPPRARAELVAGLRVVDYVSKMADGMQVQHRLENEDERRLDDLIALVHARNAIAET